MVVPLSEQGKPHTSVEVGDPSGQESDQEPRTTTEIGDPSRPAEQEEPGVRPDDDGSAPSIEQGDAPTGVEIGTPAHAT